jgi:hypothetical protein
MAVGRFQVMATIQAARARELGLPMDSALSWGLNRAIFYAAAKRGFKGTASKGAGTGTGTGAPAGSKSAAAPQEYHLGDELAYAVPQGNKLYFAIGGKTQTEEDFEKQVAVRFGGKFEAAWDEALDYVRHFDRDTLLSGEGFFASVYRPKRDEFAAKWTAMTEVASTGTKPRRK